MYVISYIENDTSTVYNSILVSDINRMSTLSFTISRFYSYPRKCHKEIVTVIEVIQTLIYEENS